MQAGDVGLLAGLLAELLDVLLHSVCVSVTISSIRAGWMRPSAISLFSAMRATSRRTGSKPLTMTTPGVSSMITSTPVAFSKRADVAAFAADDPALHFVVGNVDGAGGRFGGVGGGVALDGR